MTGDSLTLRACTECSGAPKVTLGVSEVRCPNGHIIDTSPPRDGELVCTLTIDG